jgi:hypothetical protein
LVERERERERRKSEEDSIWWRKDKNKRLEADGTDLVDESAADLNSADFLLLFFC